MNIEDLNQTKAAIKAQMQQDKQIEDTYAENIAQELFNLQVTKQRFTLVYRDYLLKQLTPQRPDLFFLAFIANYNVYFNMLQNIFGGRCVKTDHDGNIWQKGKSLDDFPSDIKVI